MSALLRVARFTWNFGIMDFHENVMRYSRFVYDWAKILLALHDDLSMLLPVIWSHRESTLLKCLGSLWGTNVTWIHHSVTWYVHCVSCPDYKFLFSLWMHTGQSVTTGPTVLQEANATLQYILRVALCYWRSWPYVWMCVGYTIKCRQLYLYCWTWANKILASSTWVVFHCVLENVKTCRIFWNVYQPYSLHVWLLLIQI